MKYCPNCREEYQDWVEKCVDCGERLLYGSAPSPQPKPKNKPQQWITIAFFTGRASIYLAAAKLESEGIPAVISDDYRYHGGIGFTANIGRIRLNVRESDIDDARRILKETGDENMEILEPLDEDNYE